MIELTQTKCLLGPEGNCYATCIAMIFELDPTLLPHFPEGPNQMEVVYAKIDPSNEIRDRGRWSEEDYKNEYWWKMWEEWFAKNNLCQIIFEARLFTKCNLSKFKCWSILSGTSPRDRENGKRLHSVVGRHGRIWYDPHPDRTGLLTIDEIEILIPLDPCKPILTGYADDLERRGFIIFQQKELKFPTEVSTKL